MTEWLAFFLIILNLPIKVTPSTVIQQDGKKIIVFQKRIAFKLLTNKIATMQ